MKLTRTERMGVLATWVAFAAAPLAVGAADQRNWIGATSGGKPPATPILWNESSNWENGNVPGKKTDVVNFGTLSGHLFVTLPSTLTIGALQKTQNGNNLYLLGDKLTVDSSGWSGNAGTVGIGAGRLRYNHIYVFADVTAPANMSGSIWYIAET